ncbi:DNA phosphorothioation-dependent restriction protein DptH [Anaeromicrobium sediminis]|nr:DNA phosphorothioation-dependent restriction protein DptH [Anaeromicrobium sediminis]
MLREFYNYLSKKVNEYFNNVDIKSGDKFNIEFEKEEYVQNLYEEIRKENNVEEFEYKVNEGSKPYKTYTIQSGDVKIIVAATTDNITVDFLTTLRNKVGLDDEQFKNTAILFIHHLDLDSILGGAISFNKKGMPFHIDTITKDINNKIENSNLTKVDKLILKLELNNKKKQYHEDNNSLFQYTEVLDVINKEEIKKEDYKNFNIFYDSGLEYLSKEKIKSRLEDNNKYFLLVDNIHKYGDVEKDLYKDFDDSGVETLKRSDWEEANYKYICISIDNKKNDKKIEYEEMEVLSDSIEKWELEEGDTPTKRRVRNIILFNKDKLSEIKVQFKFNDYLKQAYITENKKDEATAKASGKKLEVTIEHEVGTTSFNKIEYADKDKAGKIKAKFKFKIIVLDLEKEKLNSDIIESGFNVYMKPKGNRLLIKAGSENIVFNSGGTNTKEISIDGNEEIIIDAVEDKVVLKNNIELDENVKMYNLDLIIGEIRIPVAIEDDKSAPVVITSQNIWKLKREERKDFKLKGQKLLFNNKEYFTSGDFRENLDREKTIIQTEGLFFEERTEGELNPIDISINEELKEAYLNLIRYYKVNSLLPSLAYYNEELIRLSSNYIDAYLNAVDEIIEGKYIRGDRDKSLLKIGTVKKSYDEEEILLSPLYPMTVMYQLMVNKEVDDEKINDEIIKKLNSLYLIPYLAYGDDAIYKPVEQSHSKEWKYYIRNDMDRYKGSRKFVSKLVKEKIEEFISHFSYLFSLSKEASMKINLINMGDCKEVLQGILDYYISRGEKDKVENLTPIDISIYSDEEFNIFEQLSFYNTPKEIKENLDINIRKTKNYTEVDILNAYREKVHFYRKNLNAKKYNYAHICFYEMNGFAKVKQAPMSDISSGISLDGLLSGIPSKLLGDDYTTGFGTKFLDTENKLIDLAIKINSLAKIIARGGTINNEESIITTISKDGKSDLNKIYESSNWITFVDPKIDLNFFKDDEDSSDLLIIHYSDQYTSSSGYDAITVTRKSNHYKIILKEFLDSKGIEANNEQIKNLINCFNGINGDWLLKLISDRGHSTKEKLSIISAAKIGLAYFNHKDIVWVPISLEEIFRVSGGAGLKISEGLFSVKNLLGKVNGYYSDDLLFVGIELVDDEVKVHYYPVEVKSGGNPKYVKDKALIQVTKTRNHLDKFLVNNEEKPFESKIYRNFMMQVVLVSAEKMKLYNIWKEQDWDKIINSEIRTKLLRDDYTISNDLDNILGRGAIISFKERAFRNTCEVKELEEDKFLEIELPEEAGYRHIISDVEILKNRFESGESDFRKELLLSSTYKQNNGEIQKDINTMHYEESIPIDLERQIACEENKAQEYEEAVEEKIVEEKEELRPMEILFGHNDSSGREMKWYPTNTEKTFHTNTGIIGTMGTGKTQFTKSLIYQLYKEGKYNVGGKTPGILIFDYKGDYIDDDFVEATNATVYEIYNLPYNPLALFFGSNPKPLLPLHTASVIKETISGAFNLGIKQQNMLKEIIMEAYTERGIHKVNKATWNNTPPTLHDVCRIYLNREDVKEDSLYAALSDLNDFQLFEPDAKLTKPLFGLIDGVTVINLSGYDESIQNLVVAITLDLFYTQMLVKGESKMENQCRELTNLILVDEADNFLSKNFNSIKKILKEGRMFGVGTILSTQLLSHFSTGDNEYANYILTWIVHNVSDLSNKDVKFIFNTKAKQEEETIYNRIKSLEKHHSLVKFGHENRPIGIKDRAYWEIRRDEK